MSSDEEELEEGEDEEEEEEIFVENVDVDENNNNNPAEPAELEGDEVEMQFFDNGDVEEGGFEEEELGDTREEAFAKYKAHWAAQLTGVGDDPYEFWNNEKRMVWLMMSILGGEPQALPLLLEAVDNSPGHIPKCTGIYLDGYIHEAQVPDMLKLLQRLQPRELNSCSIFFPQNQTTPAQS